MLKEQAQNQCREHQSAELSSRKQVSELQDQLSKLQESMEEEMRRYVV